MAGDGAFQPLELSLGTGLEAAFQRIFMRLQNERGVARPLGAAGVARKNDLALFRRELDLEIVAPVLAELLEVAAAVRGRHAGDAHGAHRRSILCAASSMIATAS